VHALREKRAVRPFVTNSDHGFAAALLEHLIVPTFVIGADRRVLVWNDACARLTGVPAEQVIGTTDHWRAFYAERHPCLADLLLERRFAEIPKLYADDGSSGLSDFGASAESWCPMPRLGRRLYLTTQGADEAEWSSDSLECRRATACVSRLSPRITRARRDSCQHGGLGERPNAGPLCFSQVAGGATPPGSLCGKG